MPRRSDRIRGYLHTHIPIDGLCDIVLAYGCFAGQCIGTIDEGHARDINVLVALAGNMIASGSDDGDVRVYQNRDLVHRLVGHTNSVMCLVALRNNKLASGSCDRSVRVWDTRSGACLLSICTRAVNALAMLGNGRLAVGADEKTIRAYGTRSGKQLMVLRGHCAHVTALVCLVDGRLVSGSEDDAIRVWDTRRGVCLMRFEGTDDVVVGLVGLDDGRFVSRYCWRDHIDLWDTATRACSPIMGTHKNPIMSMDRMDDMIAYGCYDGTARVRCIWRAMGQADQSEVMRLGSHSDSVLAIVWLDDGTLATGTGDGKIYLWG